jgi:uncharacterized protein
MSAAPLNTPVTFNQHAIKSIADRARFICANSSNNPEIVPSPCSSVCQMHVATGWCSGCLRTLAEIGEWSDLDDSEKRKVWQIIGERAVNVAATASPPSPAGPAIP